MPSRAQFFAAAAAPSPINPGITCRICYEDLQLGHSLQLPCNPEHIFCKECITPWLLKECKCMYMCATRPWDPAPWTSVEEGLIAKTAAQLMALPWETFGVEGLEMEERYRIMKWQTYLVKRTEPSATGVPVLMMFNDERTQVQGPGWLIPQLLFLATVSFADAIPVLVANSLGERRSPYTLSEEQDWKVLIEALVKILPTSPAMVRNVEEIPGEFRRRLMEGKLRLSSDRVVDGDEGAILPFLQPDHVLFEDFQLLLEYLALVAFVAPAPESLVEIARTCESVGQISLLAKFALALML